MYYKNYNPQPAEIENTLDRILKDSIAITKKVNYRYEDELSSLNKTTRYISDKNMDIVCALDPTNLTDEQIETIASFSKNDIKSTISATSVAESTSSTSDPASVANNVKSKSSFDKFMDKADAAVKNALSSASDFFSNLKDYMPENSSLYGVLGGIASVIADGLAPYQDGVTETSFGKRQEETWAGSASKSFINYFRVNNTGRKVKWLTETPLSSGTNGEAIYGNMILGVPFTFNQYSDPNNRMFINTLVKDGRYISLTPGLPKYNGSTYLAARNQQQAYQTDTPSEMLNYLLKNGLDDSFTNKDKRYYTFKTDYEDYFAYLETMLNTLWVKLGLAQNGDEFNMYTFFRINEGDEKKLYEQYKSSIGFFIDGSSAVSESVSNSQTNFDLGAQANANADEYQQLNYITGMGQGGAVRNASRAVGIGIKSANQVKGMIADNFSETISAFKDVVGTKGVIKKAAALVKAGVTAVTDVSQFVNTQDMGAIMQSFATSNGMKVVYPELWSNSSYAKNLNFNFTFTSPYGDPLSIFKYVYVPFCALAAFAFPRQAADNGYVSPFFVRADIPGVFTSDLALMSDISWTKGGNNNLWTKDGLPREISGSFTITDLYPYLAMTKRVSFLSANPSYAVWLDNMCGMMTTSDDSSEEALNGYFKQMIRRVDGEQHSDSSGMLWNKFNKYKSGLNKAYGGMSRELILGKTSRYSTPWFHNSSI